jgi:RimJ/RimL family protein N-acetyltransferase
MIKAQSAPAVVPISYGLRAMGPAEGIPCVVTDPNPANARSVAAFRRAGLRCVGERETARARVLLMRCDNLKPAISP